MKKLLFIILLFPLLLMGQSQNENYIITKTYKAPSTVDGVDEDDIAKDVNYLDGLGRTKQIIDVGGGASGQDIIVPVFYDAYGRQVKQYLPYANAAESSFHSSQNYRDNDALLTTQMSYYSSKYPNDLIGSNPNTYAAQITELSPLNRVIEQSSPGTQWAEGGKTVKIEYGTNSSTFLPVYNFRIKFTNNETDKPELYMQGGLSASNVYPSGSLYKTVYKNENWVAADNNNRTTHEYKDKQGRLILKRQFTDGIQHDTYYVYDIFGNLTFVIPPQTFAAGNFITSTTVDLTTTYTIDMTIFNKFGYIYKYDSRNRVIGKQTPDKGVEYVVYDKLNRVVLTQNASQRDAGGNGLKWFFIKYDKFNRVAYTGEYTSTATRASLQTTIDTSVIITETRNTGTGSFTLNGLTVYYSKSAFPNTTASLELFTVNYYDNHNFPLPNITVPTATDYAEPLTTSLKTLPTGTVVRVLDPLATTTWITTAIGYDVKGRMIWSKSNNPYYTTTNTFQAKLDFIGKTMETKLGHVRADASPLTVTVNDYFTYDDSDRPAIHGQKIDNASTQEIVRSNLYDEFGQLRVKYVGGGAQATAYKFNIRGWITKINDTANLGLSLFAESIAYNQPTSGTAFYNGNISQISWKTSADNQLRNYNYTYDGLDRIKTADFTNANNSAQNTSYDLNNVTYDRNGNITYMHRAGNKIASAAQENMDMMTYMYDGNRLKRVREDGLTTSGFKGISPTNTVDQYGYDTMGNLTSDINKGISLIEYNHLGLPKKVTFTSGKYIQYIYDALGTKLKKIYYDGASTAATEYNNGLVYLKSGTAGSTLQYIPTEEGYAFKNSGGAYSYAYQLKDHLGNVRVSFSDTNKNKMVTVSEVIEENNFEPFGLKHEGYNIISLPVGNSLGQKKEYNGVEYEEADGAYNMNEMDWRHYDPAIARWVAIDPIVHYSTSPYSAFENDPVFWADPSGMDVFYNAQKTEFTGQDAKNFFSAYVSMLDTGEGSFTYNNDTAFEVLPELQIDGFRTPSGIGLGQLREVLSNHVYRYSDVHQYMWDAWLNNSIHESLDIIGFVDPTGIADGVNALMYSSEGNHAMAAISMAAILPMGDLAKGFKYADKAHTVYQAIDLSSGAVKYVGITSRDLAVREAEHKAKDAFKDLFFEEVGKTANRLDARIMEQKLINNFGLDNLYNRINSIAPSKWAQHGIK